MNKLASHLVNYIREKVINSVIGLNVNNIESRFIFHGPPLEILEVVYEELAKDHGILVPIDGTADYHILPVLIQYPQDNLTGQIQQ